MQKPFDFNDVVEAHLAHLVSLAQHKAWKRYVWAEVQRIDAEPPWAHRQFKQRFLDEVRKKSAEKCGTEPDSKGSSSQQNEVGKPEPPNQHDDA